MRELPCVCTPACDALRYPMVTGTKARSPTGRGLTSAAGWLEPQNTAQRPRAPQGAPQQPTAPVDFACVVLIMTWPNHSKSEPDPCFCLLTARDCFTWNIGLYLCNGRGFGRLFCNGQEG